MFRHFFSALCLICICFFSCKPEHIYEGFMPPTFEILSCETISDDECTIEIKVNSGVGADLQFINIELTDITTNTNEVTNKVFSLNEDKEQIVKAQIKVPQKKHDYKTHITLKSVKNTYDSKPFFLRFSEKFSQDGIKYIYFSPSGFDESYVDEEEKIALNFKKGQRFYFTIEYSQLLLRDNSIQVKLNGTTHIDVDPYYLGIFNDGEMGIYCVLPNDIAPGVYNLHVYINGLEYILDYKIKVLRGSSELLHVDSRPGKDSYLGPIANYFVINENAYYIHDGGGYWYVLCFNLKTLKWEKKNNITPDYPYQISVLHERISSENKNFFIFQMYKNPSGYFAEYESLALWEYNNMKDSWSKISTYPGIGERDFTAFAVGNNIYIGGGLKTIYNSENYQVREERMTDFWKYNTESKVWKKLNNLPYNAQPYYGYINSTTTHNNDAFVFLATRQLWKYNSLADNWEELTSLRKGSYTRDLSKLIYFENKLYLTGSSQSGSGNILFSPDLWEYDLTSGKWELFDIQENSFTQPYGRTIAGVPAFIYDGILYLGCGTLLYSYEKEDLFFKVKIK